MATAPENNPLTLNTDKTFGLSHIYADDGSYTITVTVTDSEGGQSSGTVLVSVTNVAPTSADNTVTIAEDTSYVFQTADFQFVDIGTDSLSKVQITQLGLAGSLELNGTPVLVGQEITASQISADELAFLPAANANGDALHELPVQGLRRESLQHCGVPDDGECQLGERRPHARPDR